MPGQRGKIRCTLFAKRRKSLLGIGAVERICHQDASFNQGLTYGSRRMAVDGALDRSHRRRGAVTNHIPRVFLSPFQRVVVDNPVYQPERLRLFGLDESAREQDVKRIAQAHDPRQQPGDGFFGTKAATGKDWAEFHVSACKTYVACASEQKPDPHTVAVDGCNDRLSGLHRSQIPRTVNAASGARFEPACNATEIRSGAKGAPRPSHDDRSHGIVDVAIAKGLEVLLLHAAAERIELFRPVQRNRGDALIYAAKNFLVRHRQLVPLDRYMIINKIIASIKDANMSIIPDADDTQPMLRAGVASFLRAHFSKSDIRPLRQSAAGFNQKRWRELAKAGWLGIRLPESLGGAGLEAVHSSTVVEGLAAELVPEPYIACALLPSLILARCRPDTVESHARSLAAGECLFSLAWQDEFGRTGNQVETRLLDGRVSGSKQLVPAATQVTSFIVSHMEGLAMVDAKASGIAISPVRLIDGTIAGTVDFDNAPATKLIFAAGLDAATVLADAMDEARLAIAVALLSAAREALNATTIYLRQRVQFGKPLSDFQVLQHRIVDLAIELRLAEACCRTALDHVAGNQAGRAGAIAAAKATAAESAINVTQSAIQLHGAIGYADEADIGLYLKMVLRHAAWLGGADDERQRFIDRFDAAGVQI